MQLPNLNFNLNQPRPLRTLRLSDDGGSSSSSNSTSTLAADTLSPASLPCAADGAHLLQRREAEASSSALGSSTGASATETLLSRMGSSTTVLFDGCRAAAEGQRRHVRLQGLPFAKLSLYESSDLRIELKARLLTSSVELFRCSAILLLIDAPAASADAAPASSSSAAASEAPADAAGFRCASLSFLPSSEAEEPTAPPPWTLGTLQLDAPLRGVCVSFASREAVGSIVLAPLASGAAAAEGEDATRADGAAALAGFEDVSVRYATREGWETFHLSSPSSSPSSETPASSAPAGAPRPPAGAQRLLSLTPDGQWQLEPLRRAQGAAGYTSLGANEPVAQGRRRRGSVDSGIGL